MPCGAKIVNVKRKSTKNPKVMMKRMRMRKDLKEKTKKVGIRAKPRCPVVLKVSVCHLIRRRSQRELYALSVGNQLRSGFYGGDHIDLIFYHYYKII